MNIIKLKINSVYIFLLYRYTYIHTYIYIFKKFNIIYKETLPAVVSLASISTN